MHNTYTQIGMISNTALRVDTIFKLAVLSERFLRVIEIGKLKGNTFDTKKINGNTYCANRANKFNVEMSGRFLLIYKIRKKVHSLVNSEKKEYFWCSKLKFYIWNGR